MDNKGNRHDTVGNFFRAVFNIFIFLPYFFSVPTLVRTLFAPWKNLTAKPARKSRSLTEIVNDLSFNLVSRGMGFTMRFCLLSFYILLQTFLIILLPFAALLFFVALPFIKLKESVAVPDEQRKEQARQAFLQSHVINEENVNSAVEWFERWYSTNNQRGGWWELNHLFSLPPLARDWVAGYTPTLDEYTSELTAAGYQDSRLHLVGRTKELAQIERALSKSAEANIVICGPEGVGKHTIVDALAKKIYEGQINLLLMYKRVLKLNLEKVFTVHTDAKQREALLNDLFDEALNAGNIILVVENIDRYVVSGEGRIDVSASIEKYAKAADLHFVGLTTPYLYEQYLAQNPVLERLFTKIDVAEPDKTEAYEIMLDAALLFEKRHRTVIPYETVREAVEKSEHFITAVPFPEKSLQLLDEACLEAVKQKSARVLPGHVDRVLIEKTHIPVTLSKDLKLKLLQLEAHLRQSIIDQEAAVTEVAKGLRRAFLLMGKRKKPLASFLFLGSTGVGKTETAKAIARVLFESEATLIRLDMSLYQRKEDIAQLIGSQPAKTPGLLTAALREHPYGVLLLDELEKADHDLLNIFLTMLDEGYYTDGFGRRVDCKNLIIIATSNAGADLMYAMQKKDPGAVLSEETVIDTLIGNRTYTPEFLNRFDAIVLFKPLTSSASLTIARAMLKDALEQIYSLYKVRVSVSDATLGEIVRQNYNPAFGARTMERALRVHLEDVIAKKILSEEVREGGTITL